MRGETHFSFRLSGSDIRQGLQLEVPLAFLALILMKSPFYDESFIAKLALVGPS